jgi:hypothetical protein
MSVNPGSDSRGKQKLHLRRSTDGSGLAPGAPSVVDEKIAPQRFDPFSRNGAVSNGRPQRLLHASHRWAGIFLRPHRAAGSRKSAVSSGPRYA